MDVIKNCRSANFFWCVWASVARRTALNAFWAISQAGRDADVAFRGCGRGLASASMDWVASEVCLDAWVLVLWRIGRCEVTLGLGLTHLPITLYYSENIDKTVESLSTLSIYFLSPFNSIYDVFLTLLLCNSVRWDIFCQSMLSVQQQIEKQYEFLEKIGTGSFGHIISVRSRSTRAVYAVKIEKSHGKKAVLVEKQFNLLAQLAPLPHFPRVYAFRRLKENSFLVMEQLDRNLEEIFLQRNRKFSQTTTALIAKQMLQALNDLHDAGYLHRDLKPENMMLHAGEHILKLIDFGLADHLKVRRASTLIGNVRFCSRGSHFGLSSKKDDLESLLYVLFYFATGSLPWQNSSKQDIEAEINRRADLPHPAQPDTPILAAKSDFLRLALFPSSKNHIKSAFAAQFMALATYIYELPQRDEPDYPFMLHCCDRLLLLAGSTSARCFDWCTSDCPYRAEEELWTLFK